MGTQPHAKKEAEPPPQFSVHVYCGQTAGWIKLALGMEMGLDPSHIVLDGDPAPLCQKRTEPPNFWPISIVAKRLDASLGMEVCLSTSDFVLDEDPASSPLKGHSPPIFGQCSLWPNDWMD